jgi:hypothetical protein
LSLTPRALSPCRARLAIAVIRHCCTENVTRRPSGSIQHAQQQPPAVAGEFRALHLGGLDPSVRAGQRLLGHTGAISI